MEALWFVFGGLATLAIIAVVVAADDYQELKDKVENDHDEIKKQGESIAHFDGMVQDLRIQIEVMKKEEKDEKITVPPYPVYPTTPQNPDVNKYPYVTWTGGEVTITNTETECKTPVRDRMVGSSTNEDDH